MKDGGPAFPQHVLNPTKETYGVASNNGMSLLDYFAGQALIALCANEGAARAESAYQLAREMLKAREAT